MSRTPPPEPGGAAAGRVLLADGERVALELRGHWYRLIGPAVVLLAASGGASYLAATVPESGARTALRWIIGGTAAALVLRWSVWPYLRWYANSYVLTTRRLIVREGVFARKGTDIPLGRIVAASVTRTLLQRLLGCGRLQLETSGQRGTVVIDDLPLVGEVQRAIQSLVEAAPPGMPAAAPAPPAAPHQAASHQAASHPAADGAYGQQMAAHTDPGGRGAW